MEMVRLRSVVAVAAVGNQPAAEVAD